MPAASLSTIVHHVYLELLSLKAMNLALPISECIAQLASRTGFVVIHTSRVRPMCSMGVVMDLLQHLAHICCSYPSWWQISSHRWECRYPSGSHGPGGVSLDAISTYSMRQENTCPQGAIYRRPSH